MSTIKDRLNLDLFSLLPSLMPNNKKAQRKYRALILVQNIARKLKYLIYKFLVINNKSECVNIIHNFNRLDNC